MDSNNIENRTILVVFNKEAQGDVAIVASEIAAWQEIEDFAFAGENPHAANVLVKNENDVPNIRDRLDMMKNQDRIRAVMPPLKYIGLYD